MDARGLTTSLMVVGNRGLDIRFDFIEHELLFLVTDGSTRRMKLEPRTVADLYAEYTGHLDNLGFDITLVGTPVELPEAIPFAEDTVHASYDADAMSRFWRSLVSAHGVLSNVRGKFRGKSSPVHFFWGAFDLAVTWFSGRPAPHIPTDMTPIRPSKLLRSGTPHWGSTCFRTVSCGSHPIPTPWF